MSEPINTSDDQEVTESPKRSHKKKPTERKVHKLSESVWETIEKAYVTGQMSSAQIVARWGVNRRTLEHRIRVGNWVEKRQNFSQEVTNASYDDLFDKEVNTLLKHAKLIDDILEVAPSLLQEIANSVTISVRSRVAAFKELVDASDKAVRTAREVRGIKSGEASVKNDNDKDGVEFVVVQPDNVTEIKPLGEEESQDEEAA